MSNPDSEWKGLENPLMVVELEEEPVFLTCNPKPSDAAWLREFFAPWRGDEEGDPV